MLCLLKYGYCVNCASDFRCVDYVLCDRGSVRTSINGDTLCRSNLQLHCGKVELITDFEKRISGLHNKLVKDTKFRMLFSQSSSLDRKWQRWKQKQNRKTRESHTVKPEKQTRKEKNNSMEPRPKLYFTIISYKYITHTEKYTINCYLMLKVN